MSNQSHYDALIEVIQKELKKRKEGRQGLRKVKEDDERPVYGLKFSTFESQAKRDEFLAKVVHDINHANDSLRVIAGRNGERHAELVSLLIEQFEIQTELDEKQPKAAGGFYHETCARKRLDEIKERIEEIIHEEDVCQA